MINHTDKVAVEQNYVKVIKNDDYYVATLMAFPLSVEGKTAKVALSNLKELLQIYLEYIDEVNNLI